MSSVLPYNVLKEACHRKRTTLLLYGSTWNIHSHGLRDVRETAVFERGLLTCSSWSVWAGVKVLESTCWAVRGLIGAAAAFSGLTGAAAECVQARVCNPKARGHLSGEDPSVALAVGTHAFRV